MQGTVHMGCTLIFLYPIVYELHAHIRHFLGRSLHSLGEPVENYPEECALPCGRLVFFLVGQGESPEYPSRSAEYADSYILRHIGGKQQSKLLFVSPDLAEKLEIPASGVFLEAVVGDAFGKLILQLGAHIEDNVLLGLVVSVKGHSRYARFKHQLGNGYLVEGLHGDKVYQRGLDTFLCDAVGFLVGRP